MKRTIEELRNRLWDYDRRYRAGEPVVSDSEYDRLLRRLRDLEEESGEPVPPDSPTRRLGGDVVEGLVGVPHRIPMLSIENTYSIEELREFGRKIEKLLENIVSDHPTPATDGSDLPHRSGSSNRQSVLPTGWVVELKVDGVAASLVYENGVLVQGLTRGNGIVGDDITHNIRTLRDVPLRLTVESPPKRLEVRGEIYMRNSDLVLLNEEQREKGLPTFANTRNVTAGSIRLLDPKICAERRLRFFAHSVGSTDGLRAANHFDFLKELESFGIPITPHARRFETFEAAVNYCTELYASNDDPSKETPLSDLDFEIDGLVLKLDRFDLREKVGSTSKAPRWIIAYKVEKYEAATTLREIRVQVGKTGAVTPVGELEPVELAGTTVSRASLHNAEEIERKDIRPGDVVVVEKAGKIIPHVVRVEKHLRKGNLKPYEFPTACPVCGGRLTKDPEGVYIRCNNPGCPAQVREKLRYFAGRNAMDIEGLGDKLIAQLVDTGLVRNFGDLYRLTWEAIRSRNLDRMKADPKKPDAVPLLVKNLLDGIERSRSREMNRFLNALSIRHVGIRTANILARRFGSIRNLRNATAEELADVDEIGPIIAQSVFDFFHSEEGIRTIDDLLSLGLCPGEPSGPAKTGRASKRSRKTPLFDLDREEADTESAAGDESETKIVAGPLDGMTIVVTGSLEHFKRNEIEEVVERNGGRAASSVSSKTTFVLVGADPGSKLAKAEKLGIRIVREPEFLEILNG